MLIPVSHVAKEHVLLLVQPPAWAHVEINPHAIGQHAVIKQLVLIPAALNLHVLLRAQHVVISQPVLPRAKRHAVSLPVQ